MYLQTTQGCSHNHCLFCTYFKDRAFRKSPIEEIEADIKEMPRHFGAPKRLEVNVVWNVADTLNGLMAIPNLIAVFALSPIVIKLTKDFFADPKNLEDTDKTA